MDTVQKINSRLEALRTLLMMFILSAMPATAAAYSTARQQFAAMGSMDNRGQGFVTASIGVLVGVVVLIIVAILYDALNKDTLSSGAKTLTDQITLILAAVLIVGLIVTGFAFALRRG